MNRITGSLLAGLLLIVGLLSGCTSNMKPIPTVQQVDLPRFMGDWYVIANIPTFLEKDAHNAVERYELKEGGKIATTFSFNAKSFDGERKQYNPVGFVRDTQTNASWGMQFLWPFKAEYKIIYLDEAYEQTIIGRSKRDYIWIMARQPVLSEAEYQKLIDFAVAQGYDASLIQKVPQKWDSSHKKQPLPNPPLIKGGSLTSLRTTDADKRLVSSLDKGRPGGVAFNLLSSGCIGKENLPCA